MDVMQLIRSQHLTLRLITCQVELPTKQPKRGPGSACRRHFNMA